MPCACLAQFSLNNVHKGGLKQHDYIPEIWNFGDIMVLVWTPSPHTKACVSCNCDTNAHIKFIFESHWWPRGEEPYRFWRISENKNGHRWPFCENMLHNLIKNALINFIFDVATDLLDRGRYLSILAKTGHPNQRSHRVWKTGEK